MKKLRTRMWSILLACAMLCTLLPTVALATDEHVAQVGDQTYPTLAEAVAAVEAGGTITLISNTVIILILLLALPKYGNTVCTLLVSLALILLPMSLAI